MNYKKKQRLRRARGWVYARICFPILMLLLILIFMQIPCLQYTTKDTGRNDTISAWELTVNSFDQSRGVIFGSAEQTQSNVAFSRTLLIVLILAALLFLVGCGVAIWSVADGLGVGQADSASHIAYITLVPNRIALLLWLLCLLPLPAMPRLTVLIYDVMLNYAVTLTVTFVEPMIVCGLLLAMEGAFLAILAPTEKELGLDRFRHGKKAQTEPTEAESEADAETDEETPAMEDVARQEQLAQIRRLLNRDREEP